MIKYAKEEILATSQISRNFGKVLDDLKKGNLEKVAVLKNNKIEAVLLPLKEFEKLSNMADMADRYRIPQLCRYHRAATKRNNY